MPAGFRFGVAYIHGRRYDEVLASVFIFFSPPSPLRALLFLPFPPPRSPVSFALFGALSAGDLEHSLV